METYKEIVGGDKLSDIFDLPEVLKESEVEVTISPIKEKGIRKIDLADLPNHCMGKVLTTLDRDSIYLDVR